VTATQQPDPFGAPPRPRGPSGPRGRFWLRLGASVIDGFAILLIAYVFAAINAELFYAAGWLVGIAYYSLLEGGAKGQTLGKRTLGLRVIDLARGGPIGYGRGAIRYLGRFVSAIPFGLGYLWMVGDREKQTWHDKMAGCVVVPEDAYPVD
jgi:uncharacterized RDD family membrane protein YckC